MFVLIGYDGSSGDALRVYVDVGAETTVVDANGSDATNALIMNGVLIGATHNAFVLTRYDDVGGDAAKIYAPQNKETVVVDIDGVNVADDLTEGKILIQTWRVASGETVLISVDTPIPGDAIIDGTVVFVGADRILRISGNVSFGETASLTTVVGSNGYLVTEPGVSVPDSVLTGVKQVEYNAGASNFVATTSGATWVSADPARSVLIERLVNGVWDTMGRPIGESFSAQLRENASLRLFDGANFLTATAIGESGSSFDFHVWTVYSDVVSVDAASKYSVVTGYYMMSSYSNSGETPLLFARIQDSSDGSLVSSSSVSSIVYTCYRKTSSWATETRTPVTGHENVSIPASAVKDALVDDDDRWTVDTTGYNFIFEPDSRINPIFPQAGDYVIVVTIRFANSNPCVINYNVSVN